MQTDKREMIMEAAIQLFAVKGFEGTSIREIANLAGVNLAMINYYFGSKEKLFEYMVEQKAYYIKTLQEEVLNAPALTCLQKLEKLLDNYVDQVFLNWHFHRIVQQEIMLSNRELLQHTIVQKFVPNTQFICQLIEEGIMTKEFTGVDAEMMAVSLAGTVNYMLLSRKFCNKMLRTDDSYIPYEDEAFKTRVQVHLRNIIRAHLIHH